MHACVSVFVWVSELYECINNIGGSLRIEILLYFGVYFKIYIIMLVNSGDSTHTWLVFTLLSAKWDELSTPHISSFCMKKLKEMLHSDYKKDHQHLTKFNTEPISEV